MIVSNYYCTKCEREIGADEECGKIHSGKKAKCGGKVEWRTYMLTTTKTLVAIDKVNI